MSRLDHNGVQLEGINIAAVRATPGMMVISVVDAVETKKAVFALADYQGSLYLRLPRAEAPNTDDEDFDFQIGKGTVAKEGKDVTIITTGTVLVDDPAGGYQ